MTGYTVHSGTSEKFASNWERIFGGGEKTDSGKAESQPPKAEQPTKKKSKKKK